MISGEERVMGRVNGGLSVKEANEYRHMYERDQSWAVLDTVIGATGFGSLREFRGILNGARVPKGRFGHKRTGTDDPQWQIILSVLDKNMMSF
jgi:hypothetical protein